MLTTGGDTAIVVVHWGSREATLRCLRALTYLVNQHWSLVLVDNGAHDLPASEVTAIVPRSRVVRSETNLGFAAGANLGMREALRLRADWVWFLNNDAQPEPEALDELLGVATGVPPAHIVGAKILQRARPDRLDSIALDVDLESGRVRLVGHDEVDRGQCDGLSDPVAVTGCAMLVRHDVCELLDGFEEGFFAYMEDADLCLRARAWALRVAIAPHARVLHDRAPATRGRQSVESLYYSTRNHLLLLQRHSPFPPWRRKLQEIAVIARSAAFALRAGGNPWRNLAAVRRGIGDFRRFAFGPMA